MDKETLIQKIYDEKVIAVVRANDIEQAGKIIDALVMGGINIIEITFTIPYADKLIYSLKQRYNNTDVIIGAGSVLDAETARTALLNGAEFIVSPYLNKEVVRLCNRYRVLSMPGAMTIKETVEAMEAGADIVKIFPGGVFGPSIIKNILGPLPQSKLMPTGGVSSDNIAEWLDAGAVAVGAGSVLTAGAKTGNYQKITEEAKKFVSIVRNK